MKAIVITAGIVGGAVALLWVGAIAAALLATAQSASKVGRGQSR